MLEADSHLALMEPVITYKRRGRVPPDRPAADYRGCLSAGFQGSKKAATRPLPGKWLSGLHIRSPHIS
jgi:hypothetical protein